MGVVDFTFYLFSLTTVLAGLFVVVARNPVHSVLWLILAFLSTAGLFVLIGAEFVAMLLIIVYVGAVAVLFLFVVMMLDINFVELRSGFAQYLPIGGLVGFILLAELVVVGSSWVVLPQAEAVAAAPIPPLDQVTNTEAIGRLIYTKYIYLFQAAGLVLLVAMVGAIVLTLRSRAGVRKQRIHDQVMRDPKESVKLRDVEIGKGI